MDQPAEFRFGYAVLAGQALQRSPFGVVVVVGVHAGEFGSPLGQVIDQFGYLLSFLVAVMGPPGPVDPFACPVAFDKTEKEEQSGIGTPEGVTLEVEEDIAGVGLRHQLKAASQVGVLAGFDDREGRGGFAAVETGLHLKPRLLHQPAQPRPADPYRPAIEPA